MKRNIVQIILILLIGSMMGVAGLALFKYLRSHDVGSSVTQTSANTQTQGNTVTQPDPVIPSDPIRVTNTKAISKTGIISGVTKNGITLYIEGQKTATELAADNVMIYRFETLTNAQGQPVTRSKIHIPLRDAHTFLTKGLSVSVITSGDGNDTVSEILINPSGK